MELKEKIRLLASEYEFDIKTVTRYLNTLLEYPLIKDGDEESLLRCLEMIIAERATQKLINETKTGSYLKRNLSDTFSEMIYRVYGELATTDLNQKFVKQKRLIINHDPYLEEKGYTAEEISYNGYE